jgi:hypothetical protein
MKEFYINKFIAVNCNRAAKRYHVDKGITGCFLRPGRSIWKEVSADNLHQYTYNEGHIKDTTKEAQNMVENINDFFYSFFQTAHQ